MIEMNSDILLLVYSRIDPEIVKDTDVELETGDSK